MQVHDLWQDYGEGIEVGKKLENVSEIVWCIIGRSLPIFCTLF